VSLNIRPLQQTWSEYMVSGVRFQVSGLENTEMGNSTNWLSLQLMVISLTCFSLGAKYLSIFSDSRRS